MAGQDTVRVLVVDRDRDLLDDYRHVLCPPVTADPAQRPAGQEDDVLAPAPVAWPMPPIELLVCHAADEAIEAVRRSTDGRKPFALAFIDPSGLTGPGAPDSLEKIRSLDPEIPIVIATAAPDIDPLELSARVPPADKLFYVQKPFHAAEIRQLTLALAAKGRAERAGLAAAPEFPPAGLMAFDSDDRLLAANQTVRRLFPELAGLFARGTRYEDIQRAMAERLLPEDTLYRVEAWLRDRLQWHARSGGVLEQRLRGSRWVLLAEARLESGETWCHFHDITALKRREISRVVEASRLQMTQAFGALCERLDADTGTAQEPKVDAKVVSLHAGRDGRGPAVRSSARSAGIVADDLLGRLRAVGERQKLVPERLGLDRAVAEIARQDGPPVPTNVDLEVIAGPGLWPVLVDREKLSIALGELIMNACEAMAGGGRLTLETANLRLDREFAASRSGLVPGHYVRLSVRDSGPGMSPEIAERAINPFFTTKGDAAHLGLGLSTVHGFVRQSGGYVEIGESEAGGVSVDLYFPRSEPGSARRRARSGR